MVDSPGRDWYNVFFFSIASVVGGSVSGLSLAVLGGVFPDMPKGLLINIIVFGTFILLATLRDLRVLRFWLPENRRQVRQTVKNYTPVVGDIIFGFEMGTGVRTYITGSAPYLVALVVLFLGVGITPGLLAGIGFGLARGMVVIDRVLNYDRGRWDKNMSRAKGWWPIASLGYATILIGLLIWLL